MVKNYKRDDSCNREWRVEYYGPEWESIAGDFINPAWASDYTKNSIQSLKDGAIQDWRILEGRFTQTSWTWIRYTYPKSIRQCLRVIKSQGDWLNFFQFRLANIQEDDYVIPYEILV